MTKSDGTVQTIAISEDKTSYLTESDIGRNVKNKCRKTYGDGCFDFVGAYAFSV